MKEKKKSAPKKAKQIVPESPIQDPIGDETDGEARAAVDSGLDAETEAQIDTEESEGGMESDFDDEAEDDEADDEEDADDEADDDEAEDDEAEAEDAEDEEAEDKKASVAKDQPPAKLERLQKILSQAGIASRRKAEEMIEEGRVQVNGQVVSTLGAKADAGRDHIRVDGKLLHGAERHRYFILNKPKGFVTTVSDPEGRPTVMEFFRKMPERLYPVGRLDYLSEGLLLVTNDGDLANRLTRASSGVEKTYLVKVAGQPTEEELERLREGVSIDRGQPGEGRVHTSPAMVRQVRRGDNPWFEVVLIEGRNRELRKMFEEIGHFVEKIRRVGYGPLVLDLEPGKLRELDPEELTALRLAAEGKKRPAKSADARRRIAAEDAGLPSATAPRSNFRRDARPAKGKPYGEKSFKSKSFGEKPFASKPYGDKPFKSRSYGEKPFQSKPYGERPSGRPARPFREGAGEDRPRSSEFRDRSFGRGGARSDEPRFGQARFGESKFGDSKRGEFRPKKTFGKPQGTGRPFRPRQDENFPQGERPARPTFRREEGAGKFTPRPPRADWQKRERPERPERFEGGASGGYRSRPGAPGAGRSGDRRSRSDFQGERPSQGRAGGERRSDFRPAGRSQGAGARFRIEPSGENESGFRPKPGPRFGDAPTSAERPAKPFVRRTEGAGGAKPRGAKFGANPRGPARRGPGEGAGERPSARYGAGRPASGSRSGGRPSGRPGSRPSGPGRNRPSGPKRPGPGGKRRG